MTITEAIAQIVAGRNLTREEAVDVFTEIMSGNATDAQIAGFLVGLKARGETVEEIAGAAEVMRSKATKVTTKHETVVDTCGTGGDRSGTFNISTTAAFVVAGAGLPVAKHGNRSITSKCGSADLLAGLGVNIDLSPERVGECLDEVGIGFLFAPKLHSAMKYAIDVRRQLAPTPTVFNVLGPLTNPAGATRQVMGVFRADLVEPLADVLLMLGTEQAFVVHGTDGLDEMTTTAATLFAHVKDGAVTTGEVTPEELGIKRASLEDLHGGDTNRNVAITRSVLAGEPGPCRDIVLLNASAALVAGDLATDLKDGLKKAAESIDSGAAERTLKRLVEVSND